MSGNESRPVEWYHPDTGTWLPGVFLGWEREGELARVVPYRTVNAPEARGEAGVVKAVNLRFLDE